MDHHSLGPATDRRCGQCKSTHGWCNLCQRQKQRPAGSAAALKSPVLWQAAVHEMLIKMADWKLHSGAWVEVFKNATIALLPLCACNNDLGNPGYISR